MISMAEAPSVSGEELPAVMRQSISGNRRAHVSSSNEGLSWASPSRSCWPDGLIDRAHPLAAVGGGHRDRDDLGGERPGLGRGGRELV